MNTNLISKLIKLANHNPNEHEANLAARKACMMLENEKGEVLISNNHYIPNPAKSKSQYNPNTTTSGTTSQPNPNTQYNTNPPQNDYQKKWYEASNESSFWEWWGIPREYYNIPKNEPQQPTEKDIEMAEWLSDPIRFEYYNIKTGKRITYTEYNQRYGVK